MKRRDLRRLARVFNEKIGSALPLAAVERGLRSVFAEEIDNITARRFDNVIKPIVADIERKYELTREQLSGRGRPVEICIARWDLWSRLVEAGLSRKHAGRVTGHDHSTVIHGLRRFAEIAKEEASVDRVLSLIKQAVAS